MFALSLLASLGAGLFLSNCIPHLAAGLRGEPFPTPFAKPPGKGLSSPVTNALWGSFNLVVGLILLDYAPFAFAFNLNSLAFFAGFVGSGVWLAFHFGAVRKH
jgi:hypothetical protein